MADYVTTRYGDKAHLSKPGNPAVTRCGRPVVGRVAAVTPRRVCVACRKAVEKVRVVCDDFRTDPMTPEAARARLAEIEKFGGCRLQHRIVPAGRR